jgi:hypothetical protein
MNKGADWFLFPIAMKCDKCDTPQVIFLPLTPNVQTVDSEPRQRLGLDSAALLSLTQNSSPVLHAVSSLSSMIFNFSRLLLLRFSFDGRQFAFYFGRHSTFRHIISFIADFHLLCNSSDLVFEARFGWLEGDRPLDRAV